MRRDFEADDYYFEIGVHGGEFRSGDLKAALVLLYLSCGHSCDHLELELTGILFYKSYKNKILEAIRNLLEPQLHLLQTLVLPMNLHMNLAAAIENENPNYAFA